MTWPKYLIITLLLHFLVGSFAASSMAQTTTGGEWTGPFNWPLAAVHVALLPTGEVLVWDTDDNSGQVWNPTTGTFTPVPNTFHTIFCAGHTLLADGRVLVVGGNNDLPPVIVPTCMLV